MAAEAAPFGQLRLRASLDVDVMALHEEIARQGRALDRLLRHTRDLAFEFSSLHVPSTWPPPQRRPPPADPHRRNHRRAALAVGPQPRDGLRLRTPPSMRSAGDPLTRPLSPTSWARWRKSPGASPA